MENGTPTDERPDGDDPNEPQEGEGGEADSGESEPEPAQPDPSADAKDLAEKLMEALGGKENRDLAKQLWDQVGGISDADAQAAMSSPMEGAEEDLKSKLFDLATKGFIEGLSQSCGAAIALLGHASHIMAGEARMEATKGLNPYGVKHAEKLHQIIGTDRALLVDDDLFGYGISRFLSGQSPAWERRDYSPAGKGDFTVFIDCSSSMSTGAQPGPRYNYSGDNSDHMSLHTVAMALTVAAAYEAGAEGRKVRVFPYTNNTEESVVLVGNPLLDIPALEEAINGTRSRFGDGTNLFHSLGVVYDQYTEAGEELPDVLILTDGLESFPSLELGKEGYGRHDGQANRELLLGKIEPWFTESHTVCIHLMDAVRQSYMEDIRSADLPELDVRKNADEEMQDVCSRVESESYWSEGSRAGVAKGWRFPVLEWEDAGLADGMCTSMSRFFRFLMEYTDWCGVLESRDLDRVSAIVARAFGA